MAGTNKILVFLNIFAKKLSKFIFPIQFTLEVCENDQKSQNSRKLILSQKLIPIR